MLWPAHVIAPVAPNPIVKGRFTAAFLARLLYQKYVLGLPVHRIARAWLLMAWTWPRAPWPGR
jgi:hypothetical protein